MFKVLGGLYPHKNVIAAQDVPRPEINQMGFRLSEYTDNKYVKFIAGGVITAVAVFSFYKLFSQLKCERFDSFDDDDESMSQPDEYFENVKGDVSIFSNYSLFAELDKIAFTLVILNCGKTFSLGM